MKLQRELIELVTRSALLLRVDPRFGHGHLNRGEGIADYLLPIDSPVTVRRQAIFLLDSAQAYNVASGKSGLSVEPFEPKICVNMLIELTGRKKSEACGNLHVGNDLLMSVYSVLKQFGDFLGQLAEVR